MGNPRLSIVDKSREFIYGFSSFDTIVEKQVDIFEYIMVLMTMVLGLGITENLKSIAQIDFRDPSGEPFTLLSYFLSIIILQLDYWYTIWLISDRTSWVLIDIVIWFYLPVALYLSGAFLGKALSMRGAQRYNAIRTSIIVLFTWIAVIWITGLVYFGIPLFDIQLFGPLLFLVVCLSLRLCRISPPLYPLYSLGTLAFSLYFFVIIGSNEIQ